MPPIQLEEFYVCDAFPMYVQRWRPLAEVAARPPVILIHGGAHTGICWTTCPDGRPGWARRLTLLGYETFVVDWPGVGRSGRLENFLTSGPGPVVAALISLLRHVGPALLIGFTQVITKGAQNMVSFIVVFSLGQNIGGLAGGAIVGTLQVVREKFHSSQLTESVNLGDPNVVLRLQQLSGAYARVVGDAAQRNVEAQRLLAQQITQQANVLAYNDVFLMISIAAAIGAAWVTFVHFRPRLLERRAARQAVEAATDATV